MKRKIFLIAVSLLIGGSILFIVENSGVAQNTYTPNSYKPKTYKPTAKRGDMLSCQHGYSYIRPYCVQWCKADYNFYKGRCYQMCKADYRFVNGKCVPRYRK